MESQDGEKDDMSRPAGFISYARADSDAVLPIVSALRLRGARVWVDQLDIPPGADWDQCIDKALAEASYVVVMLSTRGSRCN